MKAVSIDHSECMIVRTPSPTIKYLYGTVARSLWFYYDSETTHPETLNYMYEQAEAFITELGSAKNLLEAETLNVSTEEINEEGI